MDLFLTQIMVLALTLDGLLMVVLDQVGVGMVADALALAVDVGMVADALALAQGTGDLEVQEILEIFGLFKVVLIQMLRQLWGDLFISRLLFNTMLKGPFMILATAALFTHL